MLYSLFLTVRYLNFNTKFSSITDNSNQEMYVSLPYFGCQSDKFKLELSVLFRKYFNDISFHFIFVNPFKIGSFFKHKDVLPKECKALSYINIVVCNAHRSISVQQPVYSPRE